MLTFARTAKPFAGSKARQAVRLCYRIGMAKRSLAITSILAVALLVSCRPAERGAEQNNVVTAEPQRPVLPVAEPPLDREALLIAVAKAASATALGEDDRQAQRQLDGDRFEIRLRFGCGGTAEAAGPKSRLWTFDEQERVIRFRVEPDFSGDLPMIEALAGSDFESVEGFWLRRPWLLDAGCPVNRPTPQASAPEESSPVESDPGAAPSERVGIAQFFTAADPRTHRRDSRAYEATRVLEEGEAPSTQGYDLVLAGRLKVLPSGRVIACSATRPDTPPECIVSAEFDQVRIERADRRETIAEWSRG